MSYDSTDWNVGQKVLCVNGTFPGCIWEWCDAVPQAGHIYTLRAILFSKNHFSGRHSLSFHLEEIRNPSTAAGETAFYYARFRPLEATEQDAMEAECSADLQPALTA